MKDLFVALLGKPDGIILFQLLHATQFTIYLSLIAFVGGGLVGGLMAVLRSLEMPLARWIATGWMWFFQSAPLLMLLFLSGLGIPRLFGIEVSAWVAAIASLTLYASAFLAEIWYGAIASVPRGQWEGARSLGLSFRRTFTKVILPQAMRIALAPTVGLMVQIIKGTSLAYIIGFRDLMAIGKRWANAPVDGTEPFVIFPLVALIYFCLCFPLSMTAHWLERRSGTDADPRPLPT